MFSHGRLRRGSQALVIGVMAMMMLGATDISGRMNRIGHKMICACSCGQVLLECNHVGCPDSDRMIGELRSKLINGGSDGAILGWFAEKYGATVLAAPMRGGFDNVAWIAPFAVFVLATLGTAVLVTVWKRRTDRLMLAGVGPGVGELRGRSDVEGRRALRDRIRREMEL